MEYLSVEEARQRDGLRLVLTSGVPGPFSEAAKALFRHRNAPIALYNDEAPRVRWLEILDLAERLGTGASLFPETIDDRIRMVGLINEIAGENSLIWHARILMLHETVLAVGEEKARLNPMLQDYLYDTSAVEPARERVLSVINYLTHYIRERDNGYLIGSGFTAADIYFAYVSNIIKPQSHDVNPMPQGLRTSYELLEKLFDEFDPVLIEFRDRIFEQHLELPLTF